jgi:hypothetical protein
MNGGKKSLLIIITSVGMCAAFCLFCFSCLSCGKRYVLKSPDKKISVYFHMNADGEAYYSIKHGNVKILDRSKLGIIMEDADFSKQLTLDSISPVEGISDTYELLHGKKKLCSYTGNRRVFHIRNGSGKRLDIIFRVSDDGVAFRYHFPGTSGGIKKITGELSSFFFYPDTSVYVQPIAEARSGWRYTNPSFEEYYMQGIGVNELGFNNAGWMFPALFHRQDYWILITETAPDRDYCGCRLQQEKETSRFYIDFPQERENFPDQALYPESSLPWSTPWRIITIGKGLATIVESTLGTDLASPRKDLYNDESELTGEMDDPGHNTLSWIVPGRAAWSWALLKDYATIYRVQREFIDYAADMEWEYCLVDAEWDRQIGYEKLAELSGYGRSKSVGLLVWYNASGSWNRSHQSPKGKLLTHEDRIAEFRRLHEMGIKGIKVDFFGGDGQSMLAYYQDILEDAAQFQLVVNFHGATLPRGWHRTYPHLLTSEAVRGFEYVTFDQFSANNQPHHAAMLPFTRNVFDPMDYTPVCFSEIPSIHRVTTKGFELALSVLFVSGIQHFAEIPEGMAGVPDYVREFLKRIPPAWEDIRFIDGFPGKYVVLARKYDEKWYVAGINGEKSDKKLELDLSFLSARAKGNCITGGPGNRGFKREELIYNPGAPLEMTLNGYGGFVITFSP